MPQNMQLGKPFPRRVMTWNFMAILAFVLSFIPARPVFATDIRPGVTVHTPAQIRQYIDNSGVDIDTPTTYTVEPSLYDKPGEMDSISKNNSLKMLNNIRYVLGLQPVALDESMGKEMQAAAFVCNANGRISHYPEEQGYTKPSGMDQEVWDLGVLGCSEANLASASWAPPMNWAVLGWMGDEDDGNISRVGHRRWIMNPRMGKTGFGRSSGFYAMYSMDQSGSSLNGATMWPAVNTPKEYFENDIPWSIGLGQNISGKAIKVQLVRDRDGKTWNFTESNETPVSGKDYYYINDMSPYYIGRSETVLIFRPTNPDIHCGDVFHVNVTGDVTMSYDVNFFSLVPVESLKIPETATLSVGGSQTLKAEILPKNSSERSCTWESSDPTVVTVSSTGKITGVSVGTATITAKADGVTATCKVKVGIDSLTLPETTTVAKAGTLDMKSLLKVEPEDATIGDPTWTSSDESIATVDASGKVTGIELGEVTITASLDGLTAKCKVKVGKNIADATFTMSSNMYTYTGNPIIPSIRVTYDGTLLRAGRDYEIECKNNVDANYFGTTPYLDEISTFRIVGIGEFGGTLGEFWSMSTYFFIRPASLGSVPGHIDDVTYNGQAQTPDPVLTFAGKTLVKDKDYTITGYKNNVNAGTAVIYLEGKGNFSGTKQFPFTIKPVDLNDESVTVDPLRNLTYNGKEQEPAITVNFGGQQLKPAEDSNKGDYTITYEDNVNAGQAKAILTGQGNFTGTREVPFTIMPRVLLDEMLGSFEDVTYNGKPWTPEAAVKDGETTLKPDGDLPDYEVAYKDNINAGKATVIVTGKNNYTGQIQGTFSIKKMNLTMAVKNSSKPYGEPDPRSFSVEITLDLPAGQIARYTVKREPGEDVGTYALSIDPDSVKILSGDEDDAENVTANYEISYKDGTFTIESIDISEGDFLTISDIKEMIYTGKEICPEPDVSWKDQALKPGKDIEFSYENNVNAGEKAVITITGKDVGYTGSKSFNFTIKPADIGDAEVDPIENPVYNGNPQEPELRVTYKGIDLKPSGQVKGDYTVEYFNNVNAGERTKAILTGQGNFTGEKMVTFTILPKSLKDCILERFEDVTYNGKEWTPEPSVLDGKNQLKPGSDFTVSYKDNVNAGKATVIVSGKNNYTDELTGAFKIKPMDLTVKAKDMSKPYGDPDPDEFILVTEPDLPEGQILKSGPVTREPGEEAGQYAITFKPEDVKIMSDSQLAAEDLTANYALTCKDGTFTIGVIDITDSEDLTISEEKAVYTGEKVTIEPKVFWQGRELTVGKDVELDFENNVNAGDEAVITVIGKGVGYTGKKSFNFTILPADIADAQTNQPENPVYNGKEHCPAITATFNGKDLVPADHDHKGDYTIEYFNNVNVGSKSTEAILTGQGNFTGKKTVYFSIMPLQLTDEMLQPMEDVTYKGSEWTPEILIKAGEDIIPKTDYKVSYTENIHAGQAAVLIEPANANLEGKLKGAFTINKYPITLTAQDAAKTVGEADPAAFDVKVGQAAEGDTVLYSPFRPSWDQYKTYKERGEHFRKLVKEM